MAETDHPVAVEAQAVDAGAATTSGPKDSAPIQYDESLLEFVKGRAKQPQQPDPSERNITVDKLQAEIKKHSERIKAIKEIIESKKSSARGGVPGQSDVQRRLSTLREEFQSVLVSGRGRAAIPGCRDGAGGLGPRPGSGPRTPQSHRCPGPRRARPAPQRPPARSAGPLTPPPARAARPSPRRGRSSTSATSWRLSTSSARPSGRSCAASGRRSR
jgi:hypothetical protein